MARKKQQCGFRIPWISGSSTESHSLPPKQKSKSLSRPPFRPPGIASTSAQPQGTPKPKPQQVSNYLPSHSPSEANVKELELDSNSSPNAIERKMMFATSTPSEKDIKVASTSATIPLSNEMQKDDISALNQTLNVDDKTVSVVTLAGDNRGVTMHVAGSHSTRPKPEGTEKDEAGKTYVNSNIQSINNSIMSHGSINGRDPGVRLILPQPSSQKPDAQLSVNRVETVPYQPVVRRRCLRGLFHEPSDSEPDKPTRHGCKFRCGDNTKD
ncbi:hypothetical protein VNO78_00402 [Psophocarpus tetragonolobus]|uniref:Uncharacterized protein n=1 Tax=Psophocarpus tetragonolobus TaxID=3891 RepID=A0AAN9XU40_PSOTE